MRFKAVLFDLDGVVVDTPRLHHLAWCEAFSTLGLTVTQGEVYRLEGGRDSDIAQAIAASKGVALSTRDIESISRLKQAYFTSILEPELLQGMAEFIDQLLRENHCIALVSGTTSETVRLILQKTSIASAFEVIVTGDDVSQGKPSPEGYAMAVQHLGLSPSECLVVENAPSGIQAASAAGVCSIAITSTLSSGSLSEADAVFATIPEIAGWFFG